MMAMNCPHIRPWTVGTYRIDVSIVFTVHKMFTRRSRFPKHPLGTRRTTDDVGFREPSAIVVLH